MNVSLIVVVIVVVALVFDFTNGFHDSANAIATSIGTRALRPMTALGLAALMEVTGGLIFETRVARTMTEIVAQGGTTEVVLAALIGAIAWNLITWRFGIPSSSSHALIGALMGAAICATLSLSSVHWNDVVAKVLVPTVVSPLVGIVLAVAVTTVFYRVIDGEEGAARVPLRILAVLILGGFFAFLLNLIVGEPVRRLLDVPLSGWWFAPPGVALAIPVTASVIGRGHRTVNGHFRILQRFSAAYLALQHGHNDAQKTMGVIPLALVAGGVLPVGSGVPTWVKVACAGVIGLGTFVGGKRIIRTMGMRLVRLEPATGFCADSVAATVIGTAGNLGMPISTTHAITAAIAGAGATRRFSAVSWGTTGQILIAWILTLPAAGVLGAAALRVITALE